MIGYEQYARVKNNCCICYFGYSDEYLVQLRLLKPVIEHTLPGLRITLCCKDEKLPLVGDCETVRLSEIKLKKQSFAYLSELTFNGSMHPVEDLLVEIGVRTVNLGVPQRERLNNRCVIVTKGNYPTGPLTQSQIAWLHTMARQEGYEVFVDEDWQNSSLVMGVESVQLFEAAAHGVQTRLVSTGVGTRLYKMLFPNGEVLHR